MSFVIGPGFPEVQILKNENLALTLEPKEIFW